MVQTSGTRLKDNENADGSTTIPDLLLLLKKETAAYQQAYATRSEDEAEAFFTNYIKALDRLARQEPRCMDDVVALAQGALSDAHACGILNDLASNSGSRLFLVVAANVILLAGLPLEPSMLDILGEVTEALLA